MSKNKDNLDLQSEADKFLKEPMSLKYELTRNDGNYTAKLEAEGTAIDNVHAVLMLIESLVHEHNIDELTVPFFTEILYELTHKEEEQQCQKTQTH